MIPINWSVMEELARKYQTPPSKEIKSIWFSEGSPDKTKPEHWRNRPGIQSFIERTGLVLDESGHFLSGIPLCITRSIAVGTIMVVWGDNKVSFLDEPTTPAPSSTHV